MKDYFKEFHRAHKEDINKAGDLLANAFSQDPVWTVLLKNEPQKVWQATFQTPVCYCQTYGGVYSLSENWEGAAVWVEGNKAGFSFLRMIRSGSLRYVMAMGSTMGKKMGTVFSPLVKDMKSHMKDKNYIYLQVLGVRQDQQGKGYGSRLLKALIKKCQEENKILYLETETKENVTFYQKFGFKVLKEITLPLVNLPMWEMALLPED